jgi:pimeloyl-ACP methyl ester carboxylesterase
MKVNPSGRILAVVALALTLALLTACQKEAETPSPEVLAVTVDSVLSPDSLMIHYDVRGTGDRALVFVHCWSCDRSYWSDVAPRYAPDYRVVTLDLGGHGESSLGREDWTMASFGGDVAAVVEKLDLHNVILIGHSMGGPVALEATRRLGDRVVGIVGIDNFQDLTSRLSEDKVDAFMAQISPDFVGNTEKFVRAMFPADADSALVERVAADMSSGPPEVGLSALRNVLGYNYLEATNAVRLPIKTISSDRYPTDMARNRRAAESFKLRLMTGVGHFPFFEQPETFDSLLTETLNEFWNPPEEEA